jgi:hypothetical protein
MKDRWTELCELAIQEADPQKFRAILRDLNELLDEKQDFKLPSASDQPDPSLHQPQPPEPRKAATRRSKPEGVNTMKSTRAQSKTPALPAPVVFRLVAPSLEGAEAEKDLAKELIEETDVPVLCRAAGTWEGPRP